MISDFCIKRPVFAAVLSLLIVVLGVASLLRLPIRELPDVDSAIVGVTTTYTGASPEIVDTDITEVIEGAVAGIAGVKTHHLHEPARPRPHGDRIRARPQHRRGGQRRARRGGPGAPRPARRGRRAADHQERQRLRSGDAHRGHQRSDERRPRSRTTSSASSSTGWRRSRAWLRSRSSASGAMPIRIWLDRRAMAARNLTVDDVEQALRRNNVELPAGELKSTTRQFTVRAAEPARRASSSSSSIVIERIDGYPIRLADIATRRARRRGRRDASSARDGRRGGRPRRAAPVAGQHDRDLQPRCATSSS